MKKNRKLIYCIIIIAITSVVLLYYRRAKDYEVTYEVNNYKILEKFYKNNNIYYFSATKDSNTFEIVIKNNYTHKKKIIKEIVTLNGGNIECLYMKSAILDTYPICENDDEYISYAISELNDESFYKIKSMRDNKDNYENINIYSLNNKNIVIWNHYGFDYLSNNKKKSIKLLKKESYRDNYSFQVGEYIVLPNYDEDYRFNKVYIINLKNGYINTWEFDYYINYDFYVLGIENKKAYIIDRKDKTEYVLDPKSQKVEMISKNNVGMIFNDKWEEISMIKLANNEYSFKENNIVSYIVKKNKLYMSVLESKNDILISNKDVDRIIYSTTDIVYYISKDKLYYYSPYLGEVLSMQYNELEFNNGISIYIY